MTSGSQLRPPLLVINFKTYRSSFGSSALEIAKSSEKVSREIGIRIILAPPLIETSYIVRNVSIDVYAQYGDPLYYGAYTGHTPLEALKDIGVKGVLVNHSEKQLELRNIIRISEIAREIGIETIACSDSRGLAKMIAMYAKPSAIALEPPELIGTGIAVSKAKPEIILEGVSAVKEISKKIIVLAGAGISTKEDASRSIELGAEGILISSAIMLSKDPGKTILEFAEAILRAWDSRSSA
ncbi:MAG: triose-phosphate isomerase [Sulfolobales archaeon]